MTKNFLVRANSAHDLSKDLEFLMRDFAKTFNGYGLDKIEEKMRQQIKKQLTENGIKPTSIFRDSRWSSSLPKHAATEDTVFPKRYLNKKEWNQQTFKNNYKAWIQKYTAELKKLKQEFSWLDIDELLKPLLEIKWDDVKIHSNH